MKQIHFEAMGELLVLSEVFEGGLQEPESLELRVELDEVWESVDRVFVLFSGGSLPIPRPVELVGGVCLVPEAVLGAESFVVALIGQSDGRTVVTTNGMRVDMAAGSAAELGFVPASVDVLAWLWTWYESGTGESGGAGMQGPAGPVGPAGAAGQRGADGVPGRDGTSVEVILANNEAAALALSQANPNNVYFWV